MSAARRSLVAVVAGVLLSTSLIFGETGNDNPAGTAGSFNGEVTTGGSYDPYTGNAKRSITDLVVAGGVGEYPLGFTRTMNTRYTPGLSVEFGEAGGWRHSWQWSVDSEVVETRSSHWESMPQSYTVTTPDGRRLIFRSDPNNPAAILRSAPGVPERFQPPPPAFSGSPACYLLLPDGGKISFLAYIERTQQDDGQPVRSTFDFQFVGIIDPHGLVTTVSHEAGGIKVAEPAGRWLKLFYVLLPWFNNGAQETVLGRVEASDGRSVTYNYGQHQTSSGATYNGLVSVDYFGNPSLTAR